MIPHVVSQDDEDTLLAVLRLPKHSRAIVRKRDARITPAIKDLLLLAELPHVGDKILDFRLL